MKHVDLRGSTFGGEKKERNALCALQKVQGLTIVTDRGVMAAKKGEKCNWIFWPLLQSTARDLTLQPMLLG